MIDEPAADRRREPQLEVRIPRKTFGLRAPFRQSKDLPVHVPPRRQYNPMPDARPPLRNDLTRLPVAAVPSAPHRLRTVRRAARRAGAIGFTIACAAATIGCGGTGDGSDDADVSLRELKAGNAALEISTFCLAEFEGGASARKYGRMLDAVDQLIEAHRDGADVEDDLKDAAGSLERCGQRDHAARLDRELAP